MEKEKIFNELPSWARGAIAVTILAGAAFGTYKIYTVIQKNQADKSSAAVASNAKSEAKKLANAGEKLSFPEINYVATSNIIQTLLNGCDRVTSEEQVVEEIAKVVKKPIDWLHLVSVFGNRDIDDCGFGHTNYDLITLLKDQLDTSVIGDKVLGTTYWNTDTLEILRSYLTKIGVTL